VVEDAPAGLLSGLAAGCRTIAVNVPADAPRLNEADLILTSLETWRSLAFRTGT
jgi:sugar-phosphatase